MTPGIELRELMEKAEALVASYGKMNAFCGYATGAEFATDLRSLCERVARQDWSALNEVVAIFAPTGAWDDGVGKPGSDVANQIMNALERMEWQRLANRCN